MLTLLLEPLVRKILLGIGIALACVVGYSIWASHMRHVGAENEKKREEAIAIEHQHEVTSDAAKIDQEIAKDPTPQETLQKDWSQP